MWLQNAGWIFLDPLLSGIKGLLSTKQERMWCLKAHSSLSSALS